MTISEQTVAKRKYTNTKRLKPEERKQQILSVAKEIIVNQGFSEFSSRNVAKQAGIKLATLQYYFPTKEELFRATFETTVNQVRERIERTTEAAKDKTPDAILNARINCHLEAEQDAETLAMFFQLWAQAGIDEFAQKLMFEFYDRHLSVGTDLIKQINPEVTEDEARKRALMIMALLEGLSLFMNYKSRYIESDIREHVLVLINDVVRKPA